MSSTNGFKIKKTVDPLLAEAVRKRDWDAEEVKRASKEMHNSRSKEQPKEIAQWNHIA